MPSHAVAASSTVDADADTHATCHAADAHAHADAYTDGMPTSPIVYGSVGPRQHAVMAWIAGGELHMQSIADGTTLLHVVLDTLQTHAHRGLQTALHVGPKDDDACSAHVYRDASAMAHAQVRSAPAAAVQMVVGGASVLVHCAASARGAACGLAAVVDLSRLIDT